MKAAIIGLPQSGKSTVFAAVTGVPVNPHAAPEPHPAIVSVPDPRLAYLVGLCKPKKITHAIIEFIDVPGCSLQDAKGREDWRRFLPLIRQADGLVVVVRGFENDSVPKYRNRVDARADFEEMWDELIFADLELVTTRIDRLEKSLKKPSKTHDQEKRELVLLTRCQQALESRQPLAAVIVTEEDRRHVASYAFLTEKPLVGVPNVSEGQAADASKWDVPHLTGSVTLCASLESEIAALDPVDRPAFLKELGIEKPARDRLIQSCYSACGLQSFLTMGPEEVRAWTIPKGATAVEAAAKIHTDIARGFIRAETVGYEDLFAHKDMKGAKAAGKVRKEGKSYVVKDGDVLYILANA